MIKKFLPKNAAAKNAAWIIISKLVQAALGLVIGVLTARFLGPANFGLINYASSLVAFVVPIMNLGFTNILVQELTMHPEDEGKVLGTSTLLSLISCFFCAGGVLVYTLFADPNEPMTHVVVALYTLTLFAQAFELIQYWYQAKLLSKYTAIVSLVSYLCVFGYKTILLVTKADIQFFAVANSIDYAIIAALLWIIYWKHGGQRFSFSSDVGKRMFQKSKYYIVSSMMVTIFSVTDKIMLKQMLGESAVGCYSAALRVATMSSFVFSAIIDSFRPLVFLKKKEGDEAGYEIFIKRLFSVVIYLALLQSLVMTIAARFIILFLYGEEYSSAIPALQIVVWYSTFAYIGSVRNVWVLGENKQKYLWIMNLSGALINVALNVVFINLWGIIGAALASVITQLFTNIIMNIIVWPYRHCNRLLLASLHPKYVIEVFKKSFHSK